MIQKKNVKSNEEKDLNQDPITGAPGAHPVGTGMGAAGGGALGAAVGSVAGPVGAAIGIAAGAVIGGLAGKATAEAIDPTREQSYWEENFRDRHYVAPSATFDMYRPAYRYGWEARSRYPDAEYDDLDAELGTGWSHVEGSEHLPWEQARPATRDAFDRLPRKIPGVATQDHG